MDNFDFSGWATKANLRCSDGRVILKDAFKHNDGHTVPLVWNHRHSDPMNVLGHALLKNRDEGVYAYCKFNETESGQQAKLLVQHGDVNQLSIYANQLKQRGSEVEHGMIREVSLVLAGANPGAYIEEVIQHNDETGEDTILEDEGFIFTGTNIVSHADDGDGAQSDDEKDDKSEETKKDDDKSKESDDKKDEKKSEDEEKETEGGETLKDVFDTLDDKQKKAVYAIIAQAIEPDDNKSSDKNESIKHSEGGNEDMKTNVFDQTDAKQENTLSHADQAAILELAKSSGCGSLKKAMQFYVEENKDTLAHGIDEINQLFPEYKDVHPGAPELLERDQSWVGLVMRKAHKSPISRVRTKQADARANELRAKGYTDRSVAKSLSGNLKLIMRTTDPQTVYRRDELHRDDIIDITDFDVVAYQKVVMKHNMEEDIALAALIGDGREDTDKDKIHENHIRSIWNDEELYTIHYDVDVAAARAELQGSNTGANFGENYIYAEAIVTAALYSREKYKGKGTPDFYCTPHLLNVMLLARDLNGRRIYDSKADLAKALNVGEIVTVEQFEGKTRTTKEGKTKKLLGIFVNMANYQFGSTKGGEITNFEDFDIDFNTYKYLMETRLSGALVEVQSAIALEEPTESAEG